MRDQELFCTYLKKGIQGANILKSAKRRREAINIYKQARALWSNETRVIELADLFFITQETERRFHLDDPAVLHAREETIPLQRIGTPEDIANTVTMLLSDEARFINGQKIVVDGGQYMW